MYSVLFVTVDGFIISKDLLSIFLSLKRGDENQLVSLQCLSHNYTVLELTFTFEVQHHNGDRQRIMQSEKKRDSLLATS